MGKLVRRCHGCELVQFDAMACRRCGRAFEPLVQESVPVIDAAVINALVESIVEKVFKRVGRGDHSSPDVIAQPFSEILFGPDLPTVAAVEKALILAAHERCRNNGEKAAQMIGISKTTFYRRLARLRAELSEPGYQTGTSHAEVAFADQD